MTTDIVETLPWIDYREVFAEIEERGEAKGKAEMQVEIALKMFAQQSGADQDVLIKAMKDLGISDAAIEAARIRHSIETAQQA